MKIGPVLLASTTLSLAGCGAGPNNHCTTVPVLTLFPATAVVNSSAKPPGNQQQFAASIAYKASSPGCAVPALAIQAFPAWTNPAPIHISISSAQDGTNGLAVCKGPTGGPVTLTANAADPSSQPLSGAVQLTCN